MNPHSRNPGSAPVKPKALKQTKLVSGGILKTIISISIAVYITHCQEQLLPAGMVDNNICNMTSTLYLTVWSVEKI